MFWRRRRGGGRGGGGGWCCLRSVHLRSSKEKKLAKCVKWYFLVVFWLQVAYLPPGFRVLFYGHGLKSCGIEMFVCHSQYSVIPLHARGDLTDWWNNFDTRASVVWLESCCFFARAKKTPKITSLMQSCTQIVGNAFLFFSFLIDEMVGHNLLAFFSSEISLPWGSNVWQWRKSYNSLSSCRYYGLFLWECGSGAAKQYLGCSIGM